VAVDADSIFEHRGPIRKPGWRKALPWIVGVVAVGVIVAVIGWKYSNTGKTTATPLLNKPANDVSQVPPTVKLPPAATRVARRFIQTAVARRNLPAAYNLVTNEIRQGQTRKSWNTGNIAVVPYPVDQVQYAPMKIDFSYPNEALVEIALLPRKGAKVRGLLFQMDLVKRDGKWLVNSWAPKSSPPVPNGSDNNGAGN
jgi:hypothetical protein